MMLLASQRNYLLKQRVLLIMINYILTRFILKGPYGQSMWKRQARFAFKKKRFFATSNTYSAKLGLLHLLSCYFLTAKEKIHESGKETFTTMLEEVAYLKFNNQNSNIIIDEICLMLECTCKSLKVNSTMLEHVVFFQKLQPKKQSER